MTLRTYPNGDRDLPVPSIYTPWEPNGDAPAPWVVDEDNDERVTVRDSQGGLIAECTNGFHNDEGQWVMSAACTPLARLVAAAPELLAALIAMPTNENTDPWALEKRRSAIAKATSDRFQLGSQ